MFTPNRPPEMSEIVLVIRATIAGGTVSTATDANSRIRDVTDASPAMRVKLSSPWSQNSVAPPNPCSLIIDSAKSNPSASAFCTTRLFNAKLGMYCGDVAEMIQPLLLIGMKTPISMTAAPVGPRVGWAQPTNPLPANRVPRLKRQELGLSKRFRPGPPAARLIGKQPEQ